MTEPRPDARQLELFAPGHDISIRADLLDGQNPVLAARIWDMLPLRSTLGHVVISGEAIWAPTRLVYHEPGVMVPRAPGAVYFYAPGQTICLTYGAITESALVNQFARVVADDLPRLRALGDIVWHRTVTNPRRELVEINIRRAA